MLKINLIKVNIDFLEKNAIGGACSAYGGEEKGIVGIGGET